MTLGTAAELSESEAIRVFLEERDERSFRDLFLALAPRLLRYFVHRGCAYAMAEELTMDAMYQAYREIGSLRDRSRFLAWLFTIARNGLAQHIRKAAREVPTQGIESAAGVMDRSSDGWQRSQSGFYHWLSYLAPEEQELLELRYLDELAYEEIAAVLDIPLGTVKWRIHNAKRKLAVQLSATVMARSI